MDSMDVNEITKVIDGVYKNITDNFNPASKQMIATGKAYLKSLHGASAACSMYLDALTKLSKQAQQSSVGTSGDIGSSMMQIADVFKEIHAQQLTTLKAFYVDFLVPLETNLEKDVKVIQGEQKKFLVSHKHRVESYNKAVSNAKKVRKKSKKASNPSSSTLDKEIRIMQTMEEERGKLEAFCEEALKESLTQERRRYGFILERQASLAKHYLAFYSKGGQSLGQKLDQWMKVAKTREALPEAMQEDLVKKIQQQGEDECIYCSPRRPADDTSSISSQQLRKTKSMEAGEMLNIQNSTSSTSASSSGGNYHLTATTSRTIGNISHLQLQHQDLPITSAGTLSRAKSDTSLGMINGGNGYNESYQQHHHHHHPLLPQHHNPVLTPTVPPPDQSFRTKSSAVVDNNVNNLHQASTPAEPAHVGFAKALFAYLSNGDNQLCFLEGDMIAMIGDRNRGWQFGENLRTQKMGWFPLAYTEPLEQMQNQHGKSDNLGMVKQPGPSPVPPPMPPPLPNANNNGGGIQRTPEGNGNKLIGGGTKGAKALLIPSGRASDSLHSSNDSGFSNDISHPNHPSHHNGHPGPVAPPPQPEIDYSDEEPQHLSSEEIKAGNKWLMDRYHMSESARITSSTRRRSLSSGNLSTSDREQQEGMTSILRNNNTRNSAYLHHGAGNSPRGPHHLAPATHFYDESKEAAGGGALKKFLSRTKSLIWRRPSNAGDSSNQQYQQNGHDSIRLTRPQHALESISCADTTSELWGSHSSIVEMAEFEMKEMGPSSLMGTLKKEELPSDILNETRDSNESGDQDYYANDHMKKSGSRGMNKQNREERNGPTLPPRNEGKRTVPPNKMQLSPGSSSTNSNMSMPLPKEADNSCLVVSDHTRPKKSGMSLDHGEGPNYRIPQKEQEQSRRSKNRSSYHSHRQDEEQPMSRSAVRERNSPNNAQNQRVNRVESFAVSEAPIIPESSSKFSRRSMASGSVALSNKTSRSRVTTTSNGKQDEIRGRRKLWKNHANDDDDYNSDVEEPVENGVGDDEEDDDDEGTIDFNDNDEYDDEAASSVFMDGEKEPQEHPNNETKVVPLKEAKISNIDGTASKRSKSSDVTIRTTDTRRSRSSSAKVSGMDTVDMPKRHGGFPREKARRNSRGIDSVSVASRSKSTRSGHAHSVRSTSSPGKSVSDMPVTPPSVPQKEKGSRSGTKSSTHSGKSKQRGPMYKGRPIGSPPPIPAPPLPQQKQMNNVQAQPHPPPPPPPSAHQYNHQPPLSLPPSSPSGEIQDCSGELTEVEPDYGTIKGSPSPPRKEQGVASPSSPKSPTPQQRHHQLITMKQSIVPYGKHQSLVIRDSEGRKAAPRGGAAWKGSIRSEIHTVELITTDVRSGDKPVFDYGSFIRRRLYYPERGSSLDQKSERTGNYCGPWYDLWGEDPSVSVP